ncbi:MAG: beta-galactosidase, partial [Lentisphaerota bacterium]
NGKLILLSSRTLLDLKYEQRRDPINLKLQSLRLFAPWPLPGFFYAYASNEGKSSFQDAGKEYDQVLVRQGFLREQMDQMERIAAYRLDKGQSAGTILSESDVLRKKFTEAENKNQKALAALADAFRSELSDDLLEKKYKPALAEWKEAVEKLVGEIQGAVSRLAKEENNLEPVPLPHEFSIGKYQYDFEKKLWMRDGKIEHYFHSWHAFRKWRENLLGFPAHWLSMESFFFGSDVKDGELLDMTALKRMLDYAKINTKKQGEPQDCFFWMQNGTHFCLQPIPDWYHEKYAKNDDDFYFCRQDGKPFATVAANKMRTMKIASANFWNSSVKEIQRLRNFEVGKTLKENPELGKPTLFMMGGEAINMLDENQETGHNRSAVEAFQKTLAEKYKTIDTLNKQWNASYQSFSEITPPKARTEPSPLQYEFQKFRQSEYFTQFIVPGIKAIEDGYKEKLPAGLEAQYTFGSSYFDMTEFFDRVPVVLFHTYKMWDRKIYPRWLNYLSQASGNPWGAHEWGASEGSNTLYDLEWLRKHATREVSHQIMWRNTAPNKFEFDRGFPSNWQYGLPLVDYRLNNIVLSYFSTFWPVMKDRTLRFGTTALTAPLAQPDIALLEITSSWLNEAPVSAVRSLMQTVSIELEKKNMNYGFLYERYLLDGRQKTDGIQTIIVPNGICAPMAIDNLLEKFVKEGGAVIAFAPPGVFNEFGQPKNGFMTKVFPDAIWTQSKFSTWDAGEKVKADNGLFYQASFGKGKVIIFRSVLDWEKMREKFNNTAMG